MFKKISKAREKSEGLKQQTNLVKYLKDRSNIMGEELFIVGSEPAFGTRNMATYICLRVFPPFPPPLVFFKIEDEGGCMIHCLIELQG